MVVALAAMVVAVQAAPPLASAAPVILPPACVSASGAVFDAYGRPLAGATVAADACNGSPGDQVTTAANGTFTVGTPATEAGNAPVTVSDPGYVTKTESVAAGVSTTNYTLAYDLQAPSTVSWVRTGSSLSLSARTSAPAPLSSSGYVCSWGDNDNGELGTGNTASNSLYPVAVSGVGATGFLNGVIAIAGGGDFTLAVLSNGTVAAWGHNPYGELGDGTTTDRTTPVLVSGVGGNGILTGVVAVAARGDHSMALRSDGTVVAWGYNNDGELGNASTANSTTPVVVAGIGGQGSLSGVTALAEGTYFSLALLSNGAVAAWGFNDHGELGDGTTTTRTTPVQVVGVGGAGLLQGVSAVAARGRHSVVLTTGGGVVGWGDNPDGELGDGNTTGSTTPVVVAGVGGSGSLAGATAVAAGNNFSTALLAGGAVVDWGDNTYGELGDGTATKSTATPVSVWGINGAGNLTNVTHLDTGYVHTTAARSDGSIVSWGSNAYGQLGSGTTAQESAPVPVVGVLGLGSIGDVTAVASGAFHSLAVRSAPCIPQTKVIAELPDSSVMALIQGATDGSGYTSWTGTYSVPAGSADSATPPTIKLCAVDIQFNGNCDQAGSAPTIVTTSPGVAYPYGIDSTPPAVGSSAPTPFADMLSAPSVIVAWTDALSGVNPSSLTLTVDGSVVAPSVSGGTETYAPSAGLSAGVHVVTVTAQDNSSPPNQASYTFDFAVTTVSDSPAQAAVGCGGPNPPPACQATYKGGVGASVTFTNVPFSVDGFSETLVSSARAGYGELDRPVSFGAIPVTISTTAGPCNTTASAPTVLASHQTMVLGPAESSLAAQVPGSSAVIPSVTVTVPTTCGLLNGTATLGSATTPLGAPQDRAGDAGPILTSSLDGTQVQISGAISVCTTGGSSSVACSTGRNAHLTSSIAGNPGPAVGVPVSDNGDPDTDASVLPVCSAANGGGGCSSAFTELSDDVAFGCGTLVSGQNLCDLSTRAPSTHGYYGAYLNAFVAPDAGGGYPLWQQDHVATDGDICPDGASGSVTSATALVGAEAQALDGASNALVGGTIRGPNYQTIQVELGASNKADAFSTDTTGPLSQSASRGYLVTAGTGYGIQPIQAGDFSIAFDLVDAQGNITNTAAQAAATSTSNVWHASSPVAGRIQLVTGTEFTNPAASGYALQATMPVNFTLTYGCTGGF